MQVYRGLDIGSAKPTVNYMKEIPHHLISVIDPVEQFSVADFVARADIAVADIYQRDKIPVISGGTAFYFKNFIYGLPSLPAISMDVRNDIALELETFGLESLYCRLKRVDPNAALQVNANDGYRVTRALEVFTQSGKSILDFKQPENPRGKYDFLTIGLQRSREELYNRINKRVNIMFNDGLLEEFKTLYSQGLNPYDPGMRGIGYSEFFQMMMAGCWHIEELKEEIRRNSRRYAKRQITFFNSFSDVKWVSPENTLQLRGLVEEFIKKNS